MKTKLVRLVLRRWTVALTFGALLVGLTVASAVNVYQYHDAQKRIDQIESLLSQLDREAEQGPSRDSEFETFRREALVEKLTRERTSAIRLSSVLSRRDGYRLYLGFLGSGFGVALVFVLASSLIGADFRWDYWKTILTWETRRVKVVAAKLLTVWTLVLILLLIGFFVSWGASEWFGSLFDLPPGEGWPQLAGVVGDFAKASLSLLAYAMIATCLTLGLRSGLGGLVASAGVFLADSVLSRAWIAFRYLSPSQAVAWLLPAKATGSSIVSVVWVPRLDIGFAASGSTDSAGLLPAVVHPFPTFLAVLCLLLWLTATTSLSFLFVTKRDVQ